MGMSDCEKCWNTPCRCEWGYRNYTAEARGKLAELLGDSLPEKHPQNEAPIKNQRKTIPPDEGDSMETYK